MDILNPIAVLALLQYLGFAVLVGRARKTYGVAAPAVTGAAPFERLYRVQMNTLELLVVMLPAMYLCATYWGDLWAALGGLVYLIGRIVYWRSYVASPERRALGFLLSAGPVVAMLLATLAGIALRLWHTHWWGWLAQMRGY